MKRRIAYCEGTDDVCRNARGEKEEKCSEEG
jgi:hypothetical protein